MVRGVEEDARGIIAPDAGLAHFRLQRFAPTADIARLVDRYWLATWDLAEPYTQRVLPHPVVNMVFQPEAGGVHGVATRMDHRRLTGQGWALGVMFRPAGFRLLIDRPMSALRDVGRSVEEVFGTAGADLVDRVSARAEAAARIAAIESFLRERLASGRHPGEDTAALVEWVAETSGVTRVEQVARRAGMTVRQVQRRFADHVGLGPKSVIRRYRLYAAAESARRGRRVHWGEVAAALGYSDQAHLTRDFAATFGVSPGRYTDADAPG